MITALSIIFLIIGLILWFVFGKDKKVVPVVSFYPPEDLSLPEASMIYFEKTPEIVIFDDGKKFMSEVYALWLLRKKFLKIKKQKQYYTYEVVAFSTQEEFNKMTELELACYDAFDAIRLEHDTLIKTLIVWNNLLNKYSEKYFNQTSRFLSLLFFVFPVLLLFTFSSHIIVGVMASAVTIAIILMFRRIKYSNLMPVYIFLFFYAVIAGCIMYHAAMSFSKNPIDSVVTLITAIILTICSCNLSKRTPLGDKYYGQLLGFKDFLQKVEVPQLNELMRKDTDYFLKILPYAIELGIFHKAYKDELYEYLQQNSEDQASAFVDIREKSKKKQEK